MPKENIIDMIVTKLPWNKESIFASSLSHITWELLSSLIKKKRTDLQFFCKQTDVDLNNN